MTVPRRELRPDAKVLPEHGRASNRALVLQKIYLAAGCSRADIARATGLTRVTISEIVGKLVSEGLVVERGARGNGTPGKPATMLEINRDAFHIVGVDVSEEGILRGALLDLRGRIVARDDLATELRGDSGISATGDLIGRLIQRTDRPVLGIGVGMPGIVNNDGVVLSSNNLDWHHVPLRSRLAERFSHSIVICNDANAAALAEFSLGNAATDLLLIRVGQGVGAGLVLGGGLMYGSDFAAGELGHVVVGPVEGEQCICGKRGCLETWLGKPALKRALSRAGADREAVLSTAGEKLGQALAPVVGALNVRDVVLSGPAELLDGALLRAAIATVAARTLPELHGGLQVRRSVLGADIVLVGAGLAVLSGVLGVS